MHASVWKVSVEIGQSVEVGETLLILESMKMEIPVCCQQVGVVSEVAVTEGEAVVKGQHLVTVTTIRAA